MTAVLKIRPYFGNGVRRNVNSGSLDASVPKRFHQEPRRATRVQDPAGLETADEMIGDRTGPLQPGRRPVERYRPAMAAVVFFAVKIAAHRSAAPFSPKMTMFQASALSTGIRESTVSRLRSGYHHHSDLAGSRYMRFQYRSALGWIPSIR